MNIVDYFGPRVVKSRLSSDETSQLYKICQQSNDVYNKKLVGFIREEVGITEHLLNSSLYEVILDKVEQYLTDVDSGMWNDVINSSPGFKVLELQSAWYNKQVAMEFNPLHNHRHSADLVCVIFPKVDLDKTVTNYYINNNGDKQTGQLTFIYGERPKNDFGISNITVQPEEGDIFIFPSTLGHYTNPVLGNSVRYSVSCNFVFTKLAHRLLTKFQKNED